MRYVKCNSKIEKKNLKKKKEIVPGFGHSKTTAVLTLAAHIQKQLHYGGGVYKVHNTCPGKDTNSEKY